MRCEHGMCEELRRQIAELEDRVGVLTKGINAVDNLISDSIGVANFHRDGDIALWDELLGDGSSNALEDFGHARDMVAKYAPKEAA